MYRFHFYQNSNDIPYIISVHGGEGIPNFIQDTEITVGQAILCKKNGATVIATCDFKLLYWAIVTKTARCWHKHRHAGHKLDPEITPHSYGHQIFDKIVTNITENTHLTLLYDADKTDIDMKKKEIITSHPVQINSKYTLNEIKVNKCEIKTRNAEITRNRHRKQNTGIGKNFLVRIPKVPKIAPRIDNYHYVKCLHSKRNSQ